MEAFCNRKGDPGRRGVLVRVLMTICPGYGHFHPLVPLGRALKAAGHMVGVAADLARIDEIAPQGAAAGSRYPESRTAFVNS